MKITVPLMLVVLSSCHLEASKTDIAKKMAADLCQSRMKFSFDKIVNVQDSVFKIFRNPIDSINNNRFCIDEAKYLGKELSKDKEWYSDHYIESSKISHALSIAISG